MTDKVFLPLDPLLSNELRLGIMSILTTAEYADFRRIAHFAGCFFVLGVQ